MDRYSIKGKNIIKDKKNIYEVEYSYEIEFKQMAKKLYLKILNYKTNSENILGNNGNILFLSKEIVFLLDENNRIKSVENYLELKKKITIELYMLEIRNPDLKEVLEYIEDKIQDEKNFVDFVMEIDFMEFLFGGNQKNKIIKEFYGVDRENNVEVDVIQKKTGNEEVSLYSIDKTYLNKLLLKYRLNNENVPEYYLNGRGKKIYDGIILLEAILEIESGKRNDLEREIKIVIQRIIT